MKHRDQQAATFRELHRPGRPLVLFNVWDPGSARAVISAGAQAIATGSWSVAAAHGFEDGEKIPWPLALGNLQRIANSIEVPLTVDIEGGYDDVAATLRQALEAGAVGCNIEDGKIQGAGLYSLEEQSARIRKARDGADAVIAGAFINARTDMFLRADPSTHSDEMVEDALRRAAAYAAAGADGLFVPGLTDMNKIARICKESPLPVNIMTRPGTGVLKQFGELGVARISYGPFPYRLAMSALAQAAAEAMNS